MLTFKSLIAKPTLVAGKVVRWSDAKRGPVSFSGIVVFGVLLTTACQHSGAKVTSVDAVKGEMAIYSTGDGRSAMADAGKTEDVRNADAKLKAYLKDNEQDVDGLVALANVQVAAGNLEAAEKNCFAALRLDLKNKEARKTLAQIALRRGSYDLASIFLANIGGDQSKDGNILNMLALVELSRKNPAGAMALFQRAIKVDGDNVAARMNFGVLLLKYRQLSQAAVEFERVLKVMPEHADAKLHLAIVKAARGQREDATVMLQEVLRVDEKNPLALYNLAVVQRDGEQFEEALENLKIYMRSARGKAGDNSQVFTLIDNIQRSQAAKGEQVSDEEIQAMAQQMTTSQTEQDSVAAAESDARPKTTQPKVSAESDQDVKQASQADLLSMPENEDAAPAGEDIDDLERALAH